MKKTALSQPEKEEQKQFKVVDIQSLLPCEFDEAVKTYDQSAPDKIVKCDVLIAGGGFGAVAAAHSLCRERAWLNGGNYNNNNNGKHPSAKKRPKVCLIEETNWLGGQITSQGVSALDENYLVETSGASKHYLHLRDSIREYYLSRYTTREENCIWDKFNPGNCWVSRLAFEPKVGLWAINELLNPACDSGKLSIFHRTKTLSVESQKLKNGRSKIKSVTCVNLESGEITEFRPRICIDATEFGDLLPLSGLQYYLGEESKETTSEPHAPDIANRENVQAFVYPFVVEFCPGEDHTIEKPDGYDELNNRGQFSLAGYKMFEDNTLPDGRDVLPFWTYRRLVDRELFQDLAYKNDLSMINWESNDVDNLNLIDEEPDAVAEKLLEAKKTSLGFLYWLQTEAPRDDGGKGYKELKLRADILATEDGLSKFPYIRESRRIVPERLVVEEDIGAQYNSGARARFFRDSIGIGLYPIDIHGKQEEGAAQETKPFQIPLSALIAQDSENLIPACKNIGVSHITNGAYRLHPVEWSIGTAAGIVARESILSSNIPYKYLFCKDDLLHLQKLLVAEGEPIYWYDDVAVDHECFAEIQILSMTGIMDGETDSLHFYPDKPISRQMVAKIIATILDKPKAQASLIKDVDDRHPFLHYINQVIHQQLMPLDENHRFWPNNPLKLKDLKALALKRQLKVPPREMLLVAALNQGELDDEKPVSRAQFAEWIYAVISYKKKWKTLFAKELVLK